MGRNLSGAVLVVLALAEPGSAAAGGGETAERPRLELRTTAKMTFSPAEVVVVGRLVGGEDVEELHCPAFEWDWGDGNRSIRESDCDAFDDENRMARIFSQVHRYQAPGDFGVRLTLRRAGRVVALATTRVRVLGQIGPGQPSAAERGLQVR